MAQSLSDGPEARILVPSLSLRLLEESHGERHTQVVDSNSWNAVPISPASPVVHYSQLRTFRNRTQEKEKRKFHHRVTYEKNTSPSLSKKKTDKSAVSSVLPEQDPASACGGEASLQDELKPISAKSDSISENEDTLETPLSYRMTVPSFSNEKNKELVSRIHCEVERRVRTLEEKCETRVKEWEKLHIFDSDTNRTRARAMFGADIVTHSSLPVVRARVLEEMAEEMREKEKEATEEEGMNHASLNKEAEIPHRRFSLLGAVTSEVARASAAREKQADPDLGEFTAFEPGDYYRIIEETKVEEDGEGGNGEDVVYLQEYCTAPVVEEDLLEMDLETILRKRQIQSLGGSSISIPPFGAEKRISPSPLVHEKDGEGNPLPKSQRPRQLQRPKLRQRWENTGGDGETQAQTVSTSFAAVIGASKAAKVFKTKQEKIREAKVVAARERMLEMRAFRLKRQRTVKDFEEAQIARVARWEAEKLKKSEISFRERNRFRMSSTLLKVYNPFAFARQRHMLLSEEKSSLFVEALAHACLTSPLEGHTDHDHSSREGETGFPWMDIVRVGTMQTQRALDMRLNGGFVSLSDLVSSIHREKQSHRPKRSEPTGRSQEISEVQTYMQTTTSRRLSAAKVATDLQGTPSDAQSRNGPLAEEIIPSYHAILPYVESHALLPVPAHRAAAALWVSRSRNILGKMPLLPQDRKDQAQVSVNAAGKSGRYLVSQYQRDPDSLADMLTSEYGAMVPTRIGHNFTAAVIRSHLVGHEHILHARAVLARQRPTNGKFRVHGDELTIYKTIPNPTTQSLGTWQAIGWQLSQRRHVAPDVLKEPFELLLQSVNPLLVDHCSLQWLADSAVEVISDPRQMQVHFLRQKYKDELAAALDPSPSPEQEQDVEMLAQRKTTKNKDKKLQETDPEAVLTSNLLAMIVDSEDERQQRLQAHCEEVFHLAQEELREERVAMELDDLGEYGGIAVVRNAEREMANLDIIKASEIFNRKTREEVAYHTMSKVSHKVSASDASVTAYLAQRKAPLTPLAMLLSPPPHHTPSTASSTSVTPGTEPPSCLNLRALSLGPETGSKLPWWRQLGLMDGYRDAETRATNCLRWQFYALSVDDRHLTEHMAPLEMLWEEMELSEQARIRFISAIRLMKSKKIDLGLERWDLNAFIKIWREIRIRLQRLEALQPRLATMAHLPLFSDERLQTEVQRQILHTELVERQVRICALLDWNAEQEKPFFAEHLTGFAFLSA
jgi:hypothetical protein